MRMRAAGSRRVHALYSVYTPATLSHLPRTHACYIYIIYTYTHVRENYVNTYDSRDSFPRLVLATTTTDSSRQFYAVSLFRSLPFFLLVSSGYSIRDKSRQTDRIFHTPSFESLDRYFDSKFVKSVGEVRVKGSKRGEVGILERPTLKRLFN